MKYLLSFLVCVSAISNAQEVLENNPPSVKWFRLSTPNFKVLYPQGFEKQAQRVANTLEHIREPEAKSMGVKPKRISIILQNQSAISNGFVSIVPRRSEFYTMPPQDYNFGGTLDWLDQLASHEYRHIVQFQRANTGFNKVLYYLFGPATLSAMAITAVPQWFWEGDAVATETAFTHSGRGRIPNFGLVFRTNLQEGRVFNYHKQYLRSYKHHIPDHYVLGYHMISYLRKRTGDPAIWEKIGKRAWSVPFIPFAFSNAIKKESGLYVTQLYREMVLDIQKSYNDELNEVQFSPFEKVMKRNSKAFADYRYPQLLKDGSVLVLKIGIGDIAQLTILKDGSESKSFIPGVVNDAGMLSVSGTKVVWNEYGFDPRWQVKSFSLLKMYDVATKKHWTVTTKSRYSGAALSPDGTSIVTTESDNNYLNTLVVINSESGKVIKKFNNPDNTFYSMARWSTDGKKIVALKTKNSSRSVVSVEYETGSEVVLISPSYENIGHPVLNGNYLFYNSPVSGIDNIFVHDIAQQKIFQVTSSKYGAYNPAVSPDEKIIYYNEQSRDGLDVVSTSFDPAVWKEFTKKENLNAFYNVLAKQEGGSTSFDSIPQQNFETKKYAKLSGIINPYSWGAYFNTTFTQADLGISSQDILSTTVIKAGYLYDINERTGSWRVGISYQGWYPIVDAQVLFGKREDNFTAFGNDVKFAWDETALETGIRVPLILTHSKFRTGFEAGNYVGITAVSSFANTITHPDSVNVLYSGTERAVVFTNNNIDYTYVFRDQVNNGSLLYNKVYFSFYNLLKQSRRDFLSRWGQFIELDFYNTPFSGDFTGNLIAIRSGLFFPGFAKHHSINFRIDYQKRALGVEANLYTFRNSIFRPRGFGYPLDETFTSIASNYALPLIYPDINIGPLLNIQRIKANVFFDYGKAEGFVPVYEVGAPTIRAFDSASIYKSTGFEITFDINIMRFLPKFEIGFRSTYLFSTRFTPSGQSFEFLIGNIGF